MMKRTDLLLVRVQLRGRGHDDALLLLDEGPAVRLLVRRPAGAREEVFLVESEHLVFHNVSAISEISGNCAQDFTRFCIFFIFCKIEHLFGFSEKSREIPTTFHQMLA